jgi:GT2 family glycosyltransferase
MRIRVNNNLIASVIILGYNGKHFLEACIRSVLDQTLPSELYEVIYADNASTDGSVELVQEKFPQVKIVCFDHNLGFAEGNNQAAKCAKGRYLVFLNQDTVAHRDWLREMINAMHFDPMVKAGHATGLPLVNGPMERETLPKRGYISEVSRYGTVEPFEINLPDNPIPTLHLGGGSMILDRTVVDEIGYIFDPSFIAYCEDLDLGLRLNGLGYKVVFVPKAFCYHHREGRTKPSRKTIARTAMATRNRFIAYMKNMYLDEFILSFPYLFWGSINKMNQVVNDPLKKIIYTVGLIPFTAYQSLLALARFPNYFNERKRILSQRSEHRDRHWLMNELREKGKTIIKIDQS